MESSLSGPYTFAMRGRVGVVAAVGVALVATACAPQEITPASVTFTPDPVVTRHPAASPPDDPIPSGRLAPHWHGCVRCRSRVAWTAVSRSQDSQRGRAFAAAEGPRVRRHRVRGVRRGGHPALGGGLPFEHARRGGTRPVDARNGPQHRGFVQGSARVLRRQPQRHELRHATRDNCSSQKTWAAGVSSAPSDRTVAVQPARETCDRARTGWRLACASAAVRLRLPVNACHRSGRGYGGFAHQPADVVAMASRGGIGSRIPGCGPAPSSASPTSLWTATRFRRPTWWCSS